MKTKQFIPAAFLALWVCGAAYAQPAQLSINRNSSSARLGISGEPGYDYIVEAASDNLSSNSWELVLTTTLPNAPFGWFDAASSVMPHRFYRALQLTDPAPPAEAAGFRLIDHLGKSRALNYHLSDPAVKAVVLIFTGNGCAKVHEMIPAIKALRDQLGGQGVLFWMIDANPSDTRSNIVTEASSLGIDLPVLHDPAQVVAREYGAASTVEVFALKKETETGTTNWVVFYRGAVDDRLGPAPVNETQFYLADALTTFLSGQPVTISRTKPEGCAIPFNQPQAISYSANISPLLQDKCVRCHSPGNIAPWSMTNYNIVRSYAASIKKNVLNGEMPPWHADPFYGSFVNDASLTPQQAAMLVQWVNDGAPGDGGPDPLAVSPPSPTNYPFAWPASLGQPDLVLSIPQQSIGATGVEAYRYINVTTTFPTDTWIRAAVIRPGNRSVVHHSLVYFGSDAIFKGLLGFFAGYVPGYDPVAAPDGTARFLPRGTVLQFQMHYITTGQPETDQTEIGLYVSSTPPAHVLQTKSAPNISFTIPPNSPETQATGSFTFSKDSMLYEMSPHMHLRGLWFRYEALYPNNTREVLLSVPHYQFHWQTLYRLAQPKFMPAGTQLICTGAWDNTAQNAELLEQFNASGGDARFSPNQTVAFGDQTFNEMFIGYFNFAEVP